MKYLTSVDSDGNKEIFLFPLSVDHDCMALQVENIRTSMYGNWEITERHIVSAGFVKGRKCYGRSEPLDLDSHEDDSDLLRLHLYA